MFFPVPFDLLDTSLKTTIIRELLEVNEELKKHDLYLKPSDANEIIKARGRTLRNQGRIELDFNVTKVLIKKLADSGYVNQDNYVSTVNEMFEIFHFIKNETSDFISDEDIINAIIVFYNNVCGGSTELLMGKGAEKILHNFKLQRNLSDIVKEDDKAYWKFEE
jgi:hypothetical protein